MLSDITAISVIGVKDGCQAGPIGNTCCICTPQVSSGVGRVGILNSVFK